MVNKHINYRKLLFLLVVLGVILVFGYSLGQASPAKERIMVDARAFVLEDAGDSTAGARDTSKEQKTVKQGQNFFRGIFGQEPQTITLAYTCVAEKLLADRLIPAFQEYYRAKTGEEINVVSGYALPDFDTLATSVIGHPVQVLLMSSSTNTETRGFRPTKWQNTANKGIFLSYPQVFLVRKGNPKQINSYADLTIPGIRVLHINPLKGTGTGFWQVYGIYGAALKANELTTGQKDRSYALEQLKKTEDNAFYEFTQSKDAVKLFAEGIGDVLIISESTALNAVQKNDKLEIVVPANTVINDLAVYQMEKNISFTEQTAVGEFVDFLYSKGAQESVAEYGFRPSDPLVLASHPEFRHLVNPFKLDYLGEPTALKRDLILEKWLAINNNRVGR